MISIVNGYVCNSSCEAATAKQGKDPHAPPGAPPGAAGKTSGFDKQPATILDGALKDMLSANAVTAANSAAAANGPQPPTVNLLA